jgi:hypothetical protein
MRGPPVWPAEDGNLLQYDVTVTTTDGEPPTYACGCAEELAHIRLELAALRAEVERLTAGIAVRSASRPAGSVPAGGARDLAAERLALFQSLFAGREDVYAQRWEKDGRTGWYPQLERLAGQSWQEAKDARRYRPLTDAVVRDHLSGKISIGLYPMLADDTCRLLACDFDGEQWQLDAQAYVQAAESAGVPTAMEVSRSGQGAHVWVFFSEPVPALDARALGFGLLREAMAVRGELGLDSYDRFFPSQDYLPVKGEGLGNLIALPLQKQCRDSGTTIFVDPATFTPYPDQWAFLAAVAELELDDVQRVGR